MYREESSVGTPPYKTHMKLTIFSLTQSDFETYKCVAKNPRGETDGTIRIYCKHLGKVFFFFCRLVVGIVLFIHICMLKGP